MSHTLSASVNAGNVEQTDQRGTALLIGLGVLLLAFVPTWISFPALWASYFSHGFVVAAFTAWVVWSRRGVFRTARPANALLALPVVALSVAWMLAFVANVQVVHQTLLPLIMALWALLLFGLQLAPAIAGFAALFLLAVPVWMLLVPLLQGLTVVATGILLKIVRLEANVQGTFITIPEGTFEVAGSCSGQAFLMAGLSMAAMYLYVIPVSRKAGVRLLLLAVVLSLFANWIRVLGLIVVGHLTAMQHPLILDHGTYGWVVFAVSLMGFFAAAPLIERRWPLADENSAEATGSRDIPQLAPGETPRRPPIAHLLVATLAAVTGPALWLVLSVMPRADAPVAPPGLKAARSWAIGGVSASNLPPLLSDSLVAAADGLWQPRYIGAQEHRREIWKGEDAEVQVDRLIYPAQSQGRELVGDQNRIDRDSLVRDDRVIGPIDGSARLVRQAIVQSGTDYRVLWYWYRVNGFDTASSAKAKLLEPLAFIRRGPPAELVVVSSRCAGRSCDGALAAVARVVTGTSALAQQSPGR